MMNNLMDNKMYVHIKYKKRRVVMFFLLLFAVSFMTVGYSSDISSLLNFTGQVSLYADVGDLEIESINLVSSVNGTSNGVNFYRTDDSTDTEAVLIAEFDMNYYRTQGSDVTSLVFEIVITNNSLVSMTLNSINSVPTFSSGSSILNYSLSNGYVGTTVLTPGESITLKLTFSLSETVRNTNYVVNEVFEFNFSDSRNNSFYLNSTLETTSLSYSSFDDILAVDVNVINNSSTDAIYNYSINSSNFSLVDSEGNALGNFTISSGSGITDKIYLKINDDHMFESNNEVVSLYLNTTSPSLLNYYLGDISMTVPDSGVQDIVGDTEVEDDTKIDFTTTSYGSGLYKSVVDGETIYFYRGNVNNNYVSFAGFTWRIIKIDKYGTKVILDDVIDISSAWGTNPGQDTSVTEDDIKNAAYILSYENSSVKTVVDNWYNTNLSSYSSAINTTLFCIDTSYQTMQSSGNYGVSVYYFGAYVRNGVDADGFTPNFVCDNQYVKEYNVGLISGDEVAYAGGRFNTPNTSYYLYNNSINVNWWTLSPAYYDPSLGTVGMLMVSGSNGNFNDWVSTSTIENPSYIRPVITLDTDKLSGGTGVPGDEYTFSS